MQDEWIEAPELKELARRVIAARPEVGHVHPDRVLFFRNIGIPPKAAAECWKLKGPIRYFTDTPFAIVFYQRACEYMSPEQMALLMYHELLHIPLDENKPLVTHNVKDFWQVLQINSNWAMPGEDVPNILGE
jgi:predicted metallopeptidase